MRIPFTRVSVGELERDAILSALESNDIGGNGVISARLQDRLRERLGARHVQLTTSGTHALELAMMALRLEPDAEVILPSFTFVTSASSVVRQGARPVFAEIDGGTYNLDPRDVEARITPQTRAIMPVHYGGQGCAMNALMAIAQRHNLLVIEDAAQALGASYAGQALGTFGAAGAFSLHVTKNVVAGEGGFFVTNDDDVAERAEMIREKGTNRSQFLRGEVDKYTWVELGSSYVLSDLLAALALAQLERMDEMQRRRGAVWDRYHQALQVLEQRGDIRRPAIDSRAELNWHNYALRVTDPSRRDGILDHLRARGIGATFHYIPLHSSPYAQARWGYQPADLPITEQVAASLIRLPLFPDLGRADQDFVIDSLYAVMGAAI